MTHLTTTRARDAAGLAGAEGGEVVVEVELLGVLGEQAVDDLLVLDGAEHAAHDALRLAALEERAAVGAGQQADRHVERADLLQAATIRTDVHVAREVVGELLLEDAEGFLRLALPLLGGHVVAVAEAGGDVEVVLDHPLAQAVHLVVARLLAGDLAGLAQLLADDRLHLGEHLGAGQHDLAHAHAGGLAGLAQLADEVDQRLDAVVVAEADRGGHVGLADLGGAHLDHVDAVLVAGEHQVEVAELELGDRRVDHELRAGVGVDAAHAHGGHRALEGRVGDAERGAGGGAGDHVGIGLAVMAEHQSLQLDLVQEALGEERADRTVDHAHGEDFLLRRRAFALAEAAREAADRGVLLAVVAGQREEVDARARIGAHGGGEHHGLAEGAHDGAAGQLGHLAGLELEGASADLCLDGCWNMLAHCLGLLVGCENGAKETPPCDQGGRRRDALCLNAHRPLPPSAVGGVPGLLAQAEFLDQRVVTLTIHLRQVAEQSVALANHQQKTAAAAVILGVGLEVILERHDALGEHRHLHFGATRVGVVTLAGGDGLLLGGG